MHFFFFVIMSLAYQRLKKFRELNKNVNNDKQSAVNISVNNSSNLSVNDNTNENTVNSDDIHIEPNISCDSDINSDNNTSSKLSSDNDDNSHDIGSNESFQEELRQWVLRNLKSLQLNLIAELLLLLRKAGHYELPKTTQALLKTKHHRINQSIVSLKETNCDYKYLGIAYSLKKLSLKQYLTKIQLTYWFILMECKFIIILKYKFGRFVLR